MAAALKGSRAGVGLLLAIVGYNILTTNPHLDTI
jgi:hypothetical protein